MKKTLVETDMAFYLEIWGERPKIDFETGEPITDTKPLLQFFHHVLEKAQYPQFRHCKWNIVLVTMETHNKIHSNISTCPKIEKLRNILLKLTETGKLKFDTPYTKAIKLLLKEL